MLTLMPDIIYFDIFMTLLMIIAIDYTC